MNHGAGVLRPGAAHWPPEGCRVEPTFPCRFPAHSHALRGAGVRDQTPLEELMKIIEAKGQEIAGALAVLRIGENAAAGRH